MKVQNRPLICVKVRDSKLAPILYMWQCLHETFGHKGFLHISEDITFLADFFSNFASFMSFTDDVVPCLELESNNDIKNLLGTVGQSQNVESSTCCAVNIRLGDNYIIYKCAQYSLEHVKPHVPV